MLSTPLMQTKLKPPKKQEGFFYRQPLVKKMKKLLDYKTILIHAGAGYGKTISTLTFLHHHRLSFSWLKVTKEEASVVLFVYHLVHSIRSIEKEFGFKTLEYLAFYQDVYYEQKEEDVKLLATFFLNDLASLNKELVLVVDDLQEILDIEEINQWMDLVLEHLNNHIHFVFISRRIPNWKQISVQQIRRELLELTEVDFTFSKEDITIYFEDEFQRRLLEQEAELLFQKTRGWVIALQLIGHHLSYHDSLELLSIFTDKTNLFTYLTNEVYEKQPQEIRTFLLQSSLLEEITIESCEEAKLGNDIGRIIDYLINNHLFLYKLEDERYQYHALFQSFLQNECQKEKDMYKALLGNYLMMFERRGQYNIALRFANKLEDEREIARVVSTYYDALLKFENCQNLYDAMKDLSWQIRIEYPTLWLIQGHLERYLCLYEEANKSYEQACRIGEEKKEVSLVEQGIEGKVKIYIDTIQPMLAERYLKKVLQLTNTTAINDNTKKLIELMIENYINLGEGKKADKWFSLAKRYGISLEDKNVKARYYLRRGELQKAKEQLEKRQKKMTQRVYIQETYRETDLLLSLIEVFSGNANEAKRYAQKAIQQGVEMQAPFVEACGWIRMGHAVQIIVDYDNDLARKCYETALLMMEKIDVSRGKAEPYMGLCLLYGKEGKYDKAFEFGTLAYIEAEKAKDMWLSGLIQLAIGITYTHGKKYEEAFSYLEQAYRYFCINGDNYFKMIASFWKSYCGFHSGKQDVFEQEIFICIQAIQTYGFVFFLKERTLFGIDDHEKMWQLFIAAYQRNIHQTYIYHLLESMKRTSMLHVSTLHPGYSIRVQMLGALTVWLGEEKVEEADWKREKAKDLFCLFLLNRHRHIAKEEIILLLWPECDKEAGEQQFKVTLNTLNKVLEPKRKPREATYFIQRNGTNYVFNPHGTTVVDYEQFQHLMLLGLGEKENEQALFYLERGKALYKGDFLVEKMYEDWAKEKRRELLTIYLSGCERLAQNYIQLKKLDMAILLCEEIVTKDATWEEAYRLLMYAFYMKGNRPQAIKWFRLCKQVLEENVGIEPMEATMQMYRLILNEDVMEMYE
ncbi:MAG: BTAD domain-containing putative transcriptional regulator [Bacillaceae bacterium]